MRGGNIINTTQQEVQKTSLITWHQLQHVCESINITSLAEDYLKAKILSHISGAMTRISWHQLWYICELTKTPQNPLFHFWCHDQDLIAPDWRTDTTPQNPLLHFWCHDQDLIAPDWRTDTTPQNPLSHL